MLCAGGDVCYVQVVMCAMCRWWCVLCAGGDVCYVQVVVCAMCRW